MLCPEEICLYQRYLRSGPSTPFSIPNTLFSYHSPVTGLNQILFYFVLFYVLAMLCALWDLSFPHQRFNPGHSSESSES